MTNVLDAIERKVTPDMNDILSKPFTAEEVFQALKQMHLDKAPGPDSMTLSSFKNSGTWLKMMCSRTFSISLIIKLILVF